MGRAYDKELQEVPITSLDAPVGEAINLKDLEVDSEVIYRVLYMQVFDARRVELTQDANPKAPEVLDARPTDLLKATIQDIVGANADPPGAKGCYSSMTSCTSKGGKKRKWSEDDRKSGGEATWKKESWKSSSWKPDKSSSKKKWFWNKSSSAWEEQADSPFAPSSSTEGTKKPPWGTHSKKD